MVRDEIMPLEEAYEAEVGREGDRFKPTKRRIEIHESLKAKAAGQGSVELLADRLRQRLRPHHRRIRLSRRGNGLVAARSGGLQLRRPRHWQYGSAGALRVARAEGALAA